jgi:hypothetical protein
MKTLRLIGCIVALGMTPACYMDFGDGSRDVGGWSETDPVETPRTVPPPAGGDEWDYAGDGPFDVLDASIAGQMGPVDLPGSVYETSGTRYAGTLQVTMYARGRGGEGMGLITLSAYEGELAFDVGTRFDSAESTAVFVSALGCSGDSRDVWTFDQSPEQTAVEVAEGPSPNQRNLDYTMRFADGNVVSGTFTVAVDDDGTLAE